MKIVLLLVILTTLVFSTTVFSQDYVIIGWNDLGMHCTNIDFSTLVILPPYNNVLAHVIRVGDADSLPALMTSGFHVTYEIPNNTYSVGKTNFWDFEDQLFGVSLPDDIGLTGKGLSGDMDSADGHFIVTGVPITPFTDSDLVNEDPYQLGLLKVYDQSELLLATTQPVVPVSGEIGCTSLGCHASEQAILLIHAVEAGFDPDSTPILCATCHASNALGLPGVPELPSLSEAIHGFHGLFVNDCYRCHPGPNTQCQRGVMAVEHGLVCQDCHGSVLEVSESISLGREPWLEEPACGDIACHGPNYAEEPGKLFRESRGHGNLFCSTCHGAPHAIVPSREDRDNVQNIALQGYSGTLDRCVVCHGVTPSEPGPHGLTVICGDADGSGGVDIDDVVYVIAFIFSGGPAPVAYASGDADCSSTVDIDDVVWLISFIFSGGNAPCDIDGNGEEDC